MKKQKKYARLARNLVLASAIGLLAACSSSTGGAKVGEAKAGGTKVSEAKVSSGTKMDTVVAGETPRQAELMRILRGDCGACHGLTRRGGMGSPIRPSDLVGKSRSMLAEVILDGVPSTPMPPWRPYITPDEAMWLATVLKQGIGLK